MAKSSEKNQRKIETSKKSHAGLVERLRIASSELVYVSEIDAPFTVFEVPADGTMITEIKSEDEVVEAEFSRFFERLTRDRDWFGEREKLRAKKFLDLQKLIEESLTELRIYRVGRTKIRILMIGRSEDGTFVGLETHAVET